MSNPNVQTATDTNFEDVVLNSQIPSLVDFWALWCGPCKALAPLIEEIATANAGKINVFKLNVDENPNTAARYGIRGIPTVLIFKNGQVAHQSVGLVAKTELQKLVDRTVTG